MKTYYVYYLGDKFYGDSKCRKSPYVDRKTEQHMSIPDIELLINSGNRVLIDLATDEEYGKAYRKLKKEGENE